jgi:hypothetical protein
MNTQVEQQRYQNLNLSQDSKGYIFQQQVKANPIVLEQKLLLTGTIPILVSAAGSHLSISTLNNRSNN